MSLPAQKNTKENKQIQYNFHRFSYLKVSQAAKLLGTSPSSLRRMEEEGKILSERIPGNNYRVYRLDLVNDLKTQLTEVKNLPLSEKKMMQKAVAKQKLVIPEVITIKPIKTNADKAVSAEALKTGTKLRFDLGFRPTLALASILITIFSVLFLPTNVSKSFSDVKRTLSALPSAFRISNKTLNNKQDAGGINYSEVLAARTRAADFIHNFNLPVFFKKATTFEQGITTTGVTFTGTGLMNNLLGIDATTKTTLENNLELDGEVTATDLRHTVIADGIIDGTKLATDIAYDGNFDFTGTIAIGGAAIDATAEELNILSGATVTQGGVIFGNGTTFTQDAAFLFWDDTTKRLGIGTTNPTSQLTITPNSAGAVQINPFGTLAGNTGELRFNELLTNGDNYIGFKAPDSLSENIIFTLPSSSAVDNYILTWKPGNILTWTQSNGDISSVGSMTAGAVFGDTSADDQWLGLGSTAGRIEFDNQTTDEVNILDAYVGIGTSTPQYTLDVNGTLNVSGELSGQQSLTLAQDIIARDQLRIGDADNTVFNYIANDLSGATSAMNTNTDLYIQGDLEVNGNIVTGTGSGTMGYWRRDAGASTLSPIYSGDTVSIPGAFIVNNSGTIKTPSTTAFIVQDNSADTFVVDTVNDIVKVYGDLQTTGLISADVNTNTINSLVINAGNITSGTWSGDNISLAKGGTGASLSDPDADKIMFWDDSEGSVSWLGAGTGIAISGTTISASLPYTAENGLTLSGTTFKLGGVLTGNTRIYDSSNRDLLYLDNSNGKLGIGTTAPTALLDIGASTTVSSSFRLRTGVAPTSPNEGDIYSSGSSAYFWDGSAWKDLTLDGDISAVTAGSGLSGGGITGALTLDIGAGNGITVAADSISLDIVTTGTSANTSSNSGLELSSDGLRLLGGCLNDEVLSWDTSTQTWKCGSKLGMGSTAGSGAANQITFWAGPSTLTGSNNLYWDSAQARLGIGLTNPSAALDISGSIELTGDINGLTVTSGNITTGTWSGDTIKVDKGGTGATTLTQYGVLIGAGTGAVTGLTAGTTGQVLVGLTGSAPAFATMSGDATIAANGTVSLASTLAIPGTYGSVNTIPTITVDNKGRITSVINTSISYESPLTFSNGITRSTNAVKLGGTFVESTTLTTGDYDMIVNLNGTGDFRVQDNGVDKFFVSDGGLVGIGTSNPTYNLEVAGSFMATDYFSGDGTLGSDATISGLVFKDGLYTSGTFSTAGLGIITSVTAGSGLSGGGLSGDVTLDVGTGNGITTGADSISLDIVTTGTSANTNSNSGLELSSDGLRLLGGCSASQVLAWNSSTNVWECKDVSALSPGGSISGSGVANQLAYFIGPNTQSGLTAGTTGQVLVGLTGSAPAFATMSGDATIAANGTVTLASTLAIPGTYGGVNTIPTITVDNKGRITSVINTSISYESPLTFSNGITRSTNAVKLGGTFVESTTLTPGDYDMIVNLNGTGDFRVQDNGVDKFFVSDGGNVGIGTITPDDTLHVNGSIITTGIQDAAKVNQVFLSLPSGDNLTIDNMEYTSDSSAQASFVSSATSSGGTITTSGSYVIHTFTSSGTFIASGSISTEVLVVAGGGAGGSSGDGGGGGAGGLIYNSSFAITAQSYPVTVGNGGTEGNSGQNSVFSTLTAIGGGLGGHYNGVAGASGGSGGGGGPHSAAGGSGTSPQGNIGGAGESFGNYRGGGGGGAGAAGGAGGASGAGGVGLSYNISGSSVYYAGGGGGGGDTAYGTGGSGGGGAGVAGTSGGTGVAGTANTGGGGGGGAGGFAATCHGGAGGSGIVIIRYLTNQQLARYSESSTKNQGSYSLKAIAQQTNALNKTLTRTGSPIDLTGRQSVKFDIYASRTGANIKVGLHDSGGTTTELTPTISDANTWETKTIDISGVTNANKDAIDQIIITIVNADSANTFYIDNMYSSGEGSFNGVRMVTNGVERMRIDSNGMVGIGSTLPTSRLEVIGSGSDSSTSSFWTKNLAGVTGLFVNDLGNIGIGTTAPSQKLDIAGEVELANYLYFGNSNAEYLTWNGTDFLISDDFLPNASLALNLGSDSARWAGAYIGPGSLHIGSTSATDEYVLGYDTTANRLEFNFGSSGPAEMVLSSTGNLGIGTTSPTSRLEIVGAGSDATTSSFWTKNLAGVTGLFVSDSSGNVGIGTTAPAYKLDIAGTLNVTGAINGPTSTNTINGLVIASGNITTGTWSGDTIKVGKGGTGSTTLTQNGLLVGAGSNPVTGIAAGTTGQVLVGLTGSAPAFASMSGDATISTNGTLSLALSGVTAGTYGDANNIPRITVDNKGRITSVVNTAISYEVPLTIQNGITRATNTIKLGGTFTESTTLTIGNYDAIFNLSGTGDFRIQDDGVDKLFITDTGFVGIGLTNPTDMLSITQTSTTGRALYAYRDLASGSTNSPLVGIVQDNIGDDQATLYVQNDGTGYGMQINNNNSGTGLALFQGATGTGIGLHVYSNTDSSASNSLVVIEADNATFDQTVLYVENAGTGYGQKIYNTGTGNALQVDQEGTGRGLDVYSNVGATVSQPLAAITVDNAAFDEDALYIWNDGVGAGLSIVQNGTEQGLYLYSNVDSTANQALSAIIVDNATFDKEALYIQNDGVSNGMRIYNTGTGNALQVDQTGAGLLASFDSTNASADGILLDIQSSSAANYALRVTSGNGSIQGFNIMGNGNIGIGTTAPSQKLDIAGEVELANYLYFGNSNAEYLTWNGTDFLISDDFLPNASLALNLGSDSARWAGAYIGPGSLHIGSTSATDEYVLGYDTTANRLEFNFGSSGPAEMVLSSTGNLGIGTTTPLNKLDIYGGMALGSYAGVSTAPSNGMIISGSIGIGTINPNDTLDVNGSITTTGIQDSGKLTKMFVALPTADQTIDYMEYTSDSAAQTVYIPSPTASGGTVTTAPGDYIIHSFLVAGTFATSGSFPVEVLVVAGGGGGGVSYGAGGGGGGVIYNAFYAISSGNKTITVGSGAAAVGGSGQGNNGGNSVFDTLTAVGGGGGGYSGFNGSSPTIGSNGGSGGGGGAAGGSGNSGGSGTAGQGNNGGAGSAGASGGGGGAGSIGQSSSGKVGGNGGAGYASSISGAAFYYGGGGGGVGESGQGTSSAEGRTPAQTSGTNGLGSGGGGEGGAGGKGTVIIKYYEYQAHSSSATKSQGSYSLKGVAVAGEKALNSSITRTIGSPIDLTGKQSVKFDIYTSRTGANIKVGLHDSGGTTTELTPTVSDANTWETKTIDISGVSNTNKDAIDKIIITITNADSANTFYIDNMYSPGLGTLAGLGFTTNGSERMRINSSGNLGLGIGNIDPNARLDIVGSGNSSSTAAFWVKNSDLTTSLYIRDDGKLGIGLTNPSYKLDISDTQSASYVAQISNLDTGTQADGLLINLGIANASRNAGNYFIAFAGAGTVSGKIQGNSSGTSVVYNTTSADYAEYFKVEDQTDKPMAGDVVSISKIVNRGVVKAASPSEAVGVITNNPGFIGNGPICDVNDSNCDTNYEQTNVLVGLMGQIATKVSTQNGPITSGDPLTTSNIPGVAVKAVTAGPIIGQALENYEELNPTIVGNIKVYVNPTWYNPNTLITDTGDLEILNQEGTYKLGNSATGEAIDNVGAFDIVKSANIQAGKLDAKEILVNGVSLDQYVLGVLGEIDTTESSESSQSSSSITGLTSLSQMQTLINEFKELLATLGMTAQTGEAGDKSLVIDSNVNILGDVALANLSVSGNIQAGTITIDTINNSVDVLGTSCYNSELDTTNETLCDSQTLYIQKSGAGYLDIFDGKVVFSPNGSVVFEGPITTDKLILNTAHQSSASAGQVTIEAGETVVEIETTAITEKSMIYVTSERPVPIGSKVVSTGKFEIRLKQAETEDLPVNWMVVDRTD